MKGTTLNPENYKDFGFQNKPKYLNSKTFLNNVTEVTAVYSSTINGTLYTVKKLI